MEQQQSRGRTQVLLAASVTAAVVFLILVMCGYLFGWKWTGLPKQTLWDWLDLLIVPAVLAVGGYLFTRSENDRRERSAKEQRDLDREIADQRTKEDRRIAQEGAETDRQIADQRRQDDTLQAYLDQIGQLLLDKDKPLRQTKEGDESRSLVRARTLVVLTALDAPRRKAAVVQFLHESGLINKDDPVLKLGGANLIHADLNRAYLSGAFLWQADMSGADLGGAFLDSAVLDSAVLVGANLVRASLIGASLGEANLNSADLRNAQLIAADLTYADLSGANLYEADLGGANLEWAVLVGAEGWTVEQLAEAKSLEGATMPDGQTLRDFSTPDEPTFEDWLKDKELKGYAMPHGQDFLDLLEEDRERREENEENE